MHMGFAIGAETFSKYQHIFNFGLRTNIDLPGEARTDSLLFSVEELESMKTNLATNAFGQNFNVTMIQMAAAYCSMINGGYYYRPHIVSAITDASGNIVERVDAVEERDGKYYAKDDGEELERVVAKMSKSLKNVVNPDEMIQAYGADSVRMYEMFMGPFTVSKPWDTQGLVGINRFLDKVWKVSEKPMADVDITGKLDKDLAALRKTYAKTVKKVSEDTANLDFNVAISQMMIFVNEASKCKELPREMWEGFVLLLSPYAPHLGEELWQKLGHTKTLAYEKWPEFNEEFSKDDTKEFPVMINGKLRAKFEAAADSDNATLEKLAKETEGFKKFTEGKTVAKIIVVPGKLVNVVVK